MEYLFDLIEIGRYILLILMFLGIVMLLFGLFKQQRVLITRGLYLVILSLVLGICGYLIYITVVDRAKEALYRIESSSVGYN